MTKSDERLLVALGRVKLYGIVDTQTSLKSIEQAREEGMELKTFDFATFWRVKASVTGKRSVVFSCRQKVERGILAKIEQVVETGSPIIVNSIQKLKGAAIKNCKIIGINLSPHVNEPGITLVSQAEEIVEAHGMTVKTVSYCLNKHKNIDDLKKVLEIIKMSPILSKATIIDLGEYNFEDEAEAAPYIEVLKAFRAEHKTNFEYRFGICI